MYFRSSQSHLRYFKYHRSDDSIDDNLILIVLNLTSIQGRLSLIHGLLHLIRHLNSHSLTQHINSLNLTQHISNRSSIHHFSHHSINFFLLKLHSFQHRPSRFNPDLYVHLWKYSIELLMDGMDVLCWLHRVTWKVRRLKSLLMVSCRLLWWILINLSGDYFSKAIYSFNRTISVTHRLKTTKCSLWKIKTSI